MDRSEPLEDSPRREGFRFSHPLRVRWAEVDGQRIVYNANYLMYMDIAYGEYLRRELGLSAGFPSTVMAKTTLEYRRPIEFDNEIRVWVRTSRIGSSSMTVDFTITRDADVMMEAQTVYVYVDASGGSAPVPQEWRERLAEYEPWLQG